MKKYIKTLRSFKDNDSGNVLIMVGIFILTLFAIGGAGVDFGRAQLLKMKAQQSSDSAALAAANTVNSNPSASERLASANMYYNLNFPATYLGVARPAINYNSDNVLKVSVDANTDLTTNFIRTKGIPNLNIYAGTKVDIATHNPKYDVILVLDVSDSMDFKFDGTMCSAGAVTPCNNNDGNPATSGLPYCYTCSGSDSSTCNYHSCGDASRLTALKNAASTLRTILLTPIPPAVSANNRIAAVSWNDQFRSVLEFTNNTTLVSNFLTGLVAQYSTNSTTGLTKAQSMATASTGFQPGHVHAIVLLTDGENNGGGGAHDQSIDDSSVTICDTFKNMNPATIIYTIALGNAVAKNGSGNFIKSEGANIDAFLRKCASGDPAQNGGEAGTQYYFVAPSATELTAIFTIIATSLQKLRVTD